MTGLPVRVSRIRRAIYFTEIYLLRVECILVYIVLGGVFALRD